MIFSKLFQPKYKHKDPLIRIQAIDTLSAEESQHKSVLHELAFNDSDSRVSVAALNKLNNFDLWWKMVEIAKDERIAKHARKKVEEALLGTNDVAISQQARTAFIKECKNNSLLEVLLQKQAIDESDTALYLAVIKRLNKPQLTLRTMLNTANKALQQSLFEDVKDESELLRIAKKSKDEALTQQAQQRIEAIQTEREKPKQLEKDTTLVLSKLLALTEEQEYEKFAQTRDELQQKFAVLKGDFELLNPELAESFIHKYTDIEQKLENKAQRLQGEWDEEQALARTSAALKEATERCEQVLSVVEQALGGHAAEITLGELESFNEKISLAEQDLDKMLAANLSDAERRGIEKLINQLLSSRTSLDALPALQQALMQAEELLTQFQNLKTPDDISQIDAAQAHLDETASRWKDLSSGYRSIWPKALQNRWQESSTQWRKAIKELRNTLHDKVSRIRGRLNGISRTIEQGRFKQALRHYEQVKAEFLLLPENQQAKMSRQFEKVKEQIENLKDWQAYVATPKKPELLKEIEQLVLNPIEPEDQAERVKALRKEWNSLGVVDTETDKLLNKAFDLACEEAFKPCREFYAVQEQERLQNLNAKKALLQALAEVPKENVPELSKTLRQFQADWKNIGAVDYKELDSLNQEYKQTVEPIKQRVNQFYQDNAEVKQGLLQKAEALLHIEDWKEATNSAKKLQEQWKKIEFAGQRLENKLWVDFRSINDKIFAKRETAINAENNAATQRIADLHKQLKTTAGAVLDSAKKSEITEFIELQLSPALQELQALPRKLNADAFQYAQQLKAKLEEKLLYLGDSQRHEQYQAVFDVMQQWQGSNAPDAAAELPNYWRQAFHTANVTEHDLGQFDRHQLTLLLELLLDKSSPSDDAELRKQMQLQLMTLKLQDGVNLDPDEILRSWITLGNLSESDEALLARIKVLFLN
ncbi:DUF349 domain-containing protein [Planctobacterium marinum]|uniref:DUF349 domain-containing protein n=1 Tax=Planctobacterium marinum TaxID=1631968 RepID=A0AA48HFF9_9ALTE|nr:hypothetical protein MACH26_14990 [Planctobacterium marinum]